MRKPLIRLSSVILAAASLVMLPGQGFTAPTFGFNAAGLATLNISDFTVDTYASNLTIESVGSATKSSVILYTFPVIGGAVDESTVTFEVIGSGGLKFSNGVDVVTLDAPIINTTASPALMTYLVTINGDLQGRYAIFDLKAPKYQKQTLSNGKQFKAPNIVVTLSQPGATIFNGTLGTHFQTGLSVGSLKVKATVGAKLPG